MTLFASSSDELKKQDIENLNKVIFYASQCEYIDTLYEYLKKSGLNYTIFRPSLIFGKPNNDQEFCTQLRDTMLKLPIPAPLFFPGLDIFNAGKFEMSPIHVENVADFFVKSIQNEKHFNMTYNLGGKESFNWKKIISIISSALNKSKLMIPAPVLPIKIVAFFLDRFKIFPILGHTGDHLGFFK